MMLADISAYGKLELHQKNALSRSIHSGFPLKMSEVIQKNEFPISKLLNPLKKDYSPDNCRWLHISENSRRAKKKEKIASNMHEEE